METIEWLVDGPADGPLFVFAHGAGAGMDSPFMEWVAQNLAEQGVRVLRFEFPYMQERRRSGKKRPPDRAPKLLSAFRAVVEAAAGDEPVVIGGKSMGGRMASLLATELDVRGVACLGYPFHAPGKPDRVRIDHFPAVQAPLLILQGARDPFGKQVEVEGYALPERVEVRWLTDGDHDWKPRKASGLRHEDNMQQAVMLLAEFIHQQCGASRRKAL